MEIQKNNILVVEDEGIIALRLSDILKKNNYSPTIAASGEKAIKLLSQITPDIILMDVKLAGKLDGVETAHIIQKDFDIPVVYLSAFHDNKLLERAKMTAPYSYLTKPVIESELIACIEMALYKHQFSEKLRKSEANLRLAQKIAQIGNWSYNLVTKEIICSDELLNIIGIEKQSLTQEVIETIIHKEDIGIIRTKNIESLNGKKEQDFVFRIVKPDGNVISCRNCWISEYKNGTEIYRFGTLQDITEQINKEKQLENLIATKDKFFSIIAHDLKSPFNPILGFSDMLISSYDELEKDEYLNIAKIIQYESKEFYNLINNLLDWSASQRANISHNPKILKLNELFAKSVALQKYNYERKGIKIEIKSDEQHFIIADENSIKTVFRNLLSNAIKFSKKDSNILISSKKEGKNMKISFKDNGIGISKSNIDKVFSINNEKTTRGTEGERGTGLGLILCKEFTELNNGKISIISQEGVGTEVIVLIPINNMN